MWSCVHILVWPIYCDLKEDCKETMSGSVAAKCDTTWLSPAPWGGKSRGKKAFILSHISYDEHCSLPTSMAVSVEEKTAAQHSWVCFLLRLAPAFTLIAGKDRSQSRRERESRSVGACSRPKDRLAVWVRKTRPPPKPQQIEPALSVITSQLSPVYWGLPETVDVGRWGEVSGRWQCQPDGLPT